MKKITLLFLATILTFVISSCRKMQDIEPVTIIGKWKLSGISCTTNFKTFDATFDDFSKNPSVPIDLISYEFMEDGQYNLLDKNGIKNIYNSGKYLVSNDKKTITFTTNPDLNKVSFSFSLEIKNLTNSEINFNTVKLTQKNGEFPYTSQEDGITIYYSQKAILVKGGTIANDYNRASTIQTILNFKK